MKCKLGDFCKTNTRSYSTKENWDEIHYIDTGNITAGKIADIQCLVPGIDTIPSSFVFFISSSCFVIVSL